MRLASGASRQEVRKEVFFIFMKQKHTEVKLTPPHKGESCGERGQRGKRHEVAVRWRALLLHRLLHAVTVGDHRIAVQMPRRVRRLHGENTHTHKNTHRNVSVGTLAVSRV